MAMKSELDRRATKTQQMRNLTRIDGDDCFRCSSSSHGVTKAIKFHTGIGDEQHCNVMCYRLT